jgi:hypothetical protein
LRRALAGAAVATLVASTAACSGSTFSGQNGKADKEKPKVATKDESAGASGALDADGTRSVPSDDKDEDKGKSDKKKAKDDDDDLGKGDKPGTDADQAGTVTKDVGFGTSKTFHIGNGLFAPDSNCAFELNGEQLTGQRFLFAFEVRENDTRVKIQVNKICGIDTDSNASGIMQGDKIVSSKVLGIADNNAGFTTSTVRLNKGKYTFVVASGDFGYGDIDDFIVGEVHIRGDKKLVKGEVTSE